ncbi:hypothetical protein I315_01583 [Cryptococcus gattii Ru294]|nr:hypothetical protein I315_01583 [Cryptococcus gattii Ru294]
MAMLSTTRRYGNKFLQNIQRNLPDHPHCELGIWIVKIMRLYRGHSSYQKDHHTILTV